MWLRPAARAEVPAAAAGERFVEHRGGLPEFLTPENTRAEGRFESLCARVGYLEREIVDGRARVAQLKREVANERIRTTELEAEILAGQMREADSASVFQQLRQKLQKMNTAIDPKDRELAQQQIELARQRVELSRQRAEIARQRDELTRTKADFEDHKKHARIRHRRGLRQEREQERERARQEREQERERVRDMLERMTARLDVLEQRKFETEESVEMHRRNR